MTLVSVRRELIAEEATNGDRNGWTPAGLVEDPHRPLVTILVGNNVVYIAISSVVTVPVVSRLSAGLAVAATPLLTSVLVLVVGEIVPEADGLANARQWSLTVAAPVRLLQRIPSPIFTVYDAITRRTSALLPVDPDIEKPCAE